MIERVSIERVGHRGDGVANASDGPVFVPFALPGEVVDVELPEGRRADRAAIRSIVTASPDRIDPFCSYFGTCGGCAIQHWKPERYAEWKHGLVVGALAQHGLEAPVDPLADAHGEGRRRATLHARRSRRGVLSVGFAARRSHAIVPIEECPLFAPPLRRAFAIAGRLAAALEPAGKPLDLQFTATDGGLDVDIRGSGPLSPAQIETLAGIAREARLARLTRHGELVLRIAEPALAVGRAKVTLPPGAFLQPTRAGEEALAAIVLEAVGNSRRIADLFCGVGTFALRLAEQARIFAADLDAAAIGALEAAAKTTGLRSVACVTRDLFRHPYTAGELVPCNIVVLDPPRQGAEAQARELAQAGLKRIVYVSCDPASFARDAAIILAGGYRLSRVVPVDQFRHSAHVELVGLFDR